MSINIQAATPLPRTSLTALNQGSESIILYYQGYDGKIYDKKYEKPRQLSRIMARSMSIDIFRNSATRPAPLYAPMAAVSYNGRTVAFYRDDSNVVVTADFIPINSEPGTVKTTVILDPWFNVHSTSFSQLAALSVDNQWGGTWVYYQNNDHPGRIVEIWNRASVDRPRIEARFTVIETGVGALEGTHIAATTMPTQDGTQQTGSFFFQAPNMSLNESHWTGGNSGQWENHLVLAPSTEIAPRTALAAARLPSGNIYVVYLTSDNEVIELYRPSDTFEWTSCALGIHTIPASNLALVADVNEKYLYLFYQKAIGQDIEMYSYQPSNYTVAFAA